MAKAKKQSYYEKATGDMIKVGVGNLIGVGLIGATAGAVGGIPAGTAHTVAGIVPGLQGVALMGPNIKLIDDNFGGGIVSTKKKTNSKKKKK